MKTGHRKLVQHFEQARHLHELTFSCYRRKPLLTNDRWRELLGKSLHSACQTEQFQLVAFVFMPEHVHLLVLPQSLDSKVSRLLARTKQPFSKQIRMLLESCHSPLLDQLTIEERPGKCCFRFWQEGAGFDRNLFSSAAIAASIDDIHMNPVKRRLCEKAIDFKWSSARFHLENITDVHLPQLTKLDPEWFHDSGTHVEQA